MGFISRVMDWQSREYRDDDLYKIRNSKNCETEYSQPFATFDGNMVQSERKL